MTKNVFDQFVGIVSVTQRKGVNAVRLCKECGRVFDLLDAVDADEWYYGHDCEEEQ